MGNATGAHDPSVADYRATSPRFAQGGNEKAPMPQSMRHCSIQSVEPLRVASHATSRSRLHHRCHPERSEGPFVYTHKGPSLRSG